MKAVGVEAATTTRRRMRESFVLSQFLLAACVHLYAAPPTAPLKLIQTIPVPQVACRNTDLSAQQLAQAVNTERMRNIPCHFDRFGLDEKGGRLFAVAEDNGSVEVYAIPSGKLLHSISGLGLVHNVICPPDVNRIYVTEENIPGSADTYGRLQIYDGTTYRLLKTVQLLPVADSMGYDPADHYLYIVNGGEFAKLDHVLITVVSTRTDDRIGDISVSVPRLEHMVTDRSSSRIYVCITDGRIGVIDTKKQTLVDSWPIAEGKLNAALDLDETGHRLFVACRSGTLNVFDTTTGKVIATLPIAKGVDDVVYDPAHKRVYVACAEGVLDVYAQNDPNHYILVAKVTTGQMGKNCILVSSLNRLYVGVPRNGNVESRILVYSIE